MYKYCILLLRYMNLPMKTIEVVAAVILRGNKVFCTQRGYGDFKDMWEFPGGKMEPGETPQEALKREIREELATEIEVGEFIHTIEWDYPKFHLTMHCFFCTVLSGKLELLEHEAAQWVEREKLDEVDWLPADRTIIPMVKNYLGK